MYMLAYICISYLLAMVWYTWGVSGIEGWLTLEEAAQKLCIARSTMLRYLREGRFPRSKVGRSYFIPERAIEEFLRAHMVAEPHRDAWHVIKLTYYIIK